MNENLDFEKICEILDRKYDNDKPYQGAVVILSDGEVHHRYVAGDVETILNGLADTAASVIEKVSDSPADVLHYRLELMRGVADECARLWKENRGETIGGWKDE